MKLSKQCIANLGRAVIAAFVAQVVAGAMCLMPADAMAAPHASHGSAMHAGACVMDHGKVQSHARHACPHCDAPDQAVSQIDITHGLQAPALVPVLLVMPAPLPVSERVEAQPAPRILAPPDSTSLLYSTNRRIRI